MLIQGLVLGFSVAAPVGPIGLLCIRRTLAMGRLSGFLTGLGAATADAIYGIIAALGLTAVSTLLAEHAFWLRLAGGVFLVYLGIRTLLARPAEKAAEGSSTARLSACFASSLLLTVTNPLTILSFAAAFSGLGLNAAAGWTGGLLLVL